MTTLLLRLAGPLQSWGTRSRFSYRFTDPQPSKSGVLGLLAAAQGRRRSDPIEDLFDLRFGVRRDQPGSIMRDFQTARSLDGKASMPLTQRYYLSDAVFIAAVEGPTELVDGLADAVRHPRFPLYLGRRSCPPAMQVYLGVRSAGIQEVLCSADPDVGTPWQAARWWRERQGMDVELEVIHDVGPGEVTSELVPDAPQSFDPEHRRYAMRPVVHATCAVSNDLGRIERGRVTEHDPMALTES